MQREISTRSAISCGTPASFSTGSRGVHLKRSRTTSNLDAILAYVLRDVSLGKEQTSCHKRFYTYNSRPMFNLKPSLAVTPKHTRFVIAKKVQRAPCLAIRRYLGFTIERRTALLKLILADLVAQCIRGRGQHG